MEISGSVSVILQQKNDPVWSIGPTATVYEAVEMMAGKGIGVLPVVQEGRLIGMVSERDYTRKVVLKGKSSKSTPVTDIMTDTLVVARPGDSLAECMETMTERRIRHLPVLEGEKLVGIISIGDLVKWIISAQDATIDQLTKYVFGE